MSCCHSFSVLAPERGPCTFQCCRQSAICLISCPAAEPCTDNTGRSVTVVEKLELQTEAKIGKPTVKSDFSRKDVSGRTASSPNWAAPPPPAERQQDWMQPAAVLACHLLCLLHETTSRQGLLPPVWTVNGSSGCPSRTSALGFQEKLPWHACNKTSRGVPSEEGLSAKTSAKACSGSIEASIMRIDRLIPSILARHRVCRVWNVQDLDNSRFPDHFCISCSPLVVRLTYKSPFRKPLRTLIELKHWRRENCLHNEDGATAFA